MPEELYAGPTRPRLYPTAMFWAEARPTWSQVMCASGVVVDFLPSYVWADCLAMAYNVQPHIARDTFAIFRRCAQPS